MNIDTIIANLITATETERQLKKQIDELKRQVLAYAGNADGFETEDFSVTIEKTSSVRLDTKALYNDFPDIKETYGKITVSRSIVPVAKANMKTA